MTNAQRVKYLRERHGMSLAQLSHKTGINLRTLQNWEQSRFEPNSMGLLIISNLENDEIFKKWTNQSLAFS
jgi:DNA-binding transcriptional regulator YiaG